MSIGMQVFAFLLVLGPLVFIHELGHFLAAKRAGIRVLDGGADVQSVYNFARIRYGFATLGARF